jgi:hypothetical protein
MTTTLLARRNRKIRRALKAHQLDPDAPAIILLPEPRAETANAHNGGEPSSIVNFGKGR